MSTLQPPNPPPKFATARDLSRPTRGGRQAEFSRIWLRSPLMPWQRQVLDVAGELRPDGLPVYPLVVTTVQRQAGKSHLCMARKGERCLSCPGYRSWYTAQTGGDARDQFLKFQTDVIEGTPLDRVVRTLVGNGREVMKFPRQSWIRPHPPTKKALHGKQSDDNDIDEGWAFTLEEGRELMQAIGPTQLTRPGAQTWIHSAGGTPESTWLAELVARGRDGDPGIAYFEWGIPDDADAEDLDVIYAHHPAAGHTITKESLASLRELFKDDPAGWARAAGNRWTEIIGGAIPTEVWTAARHVEELPEEVLVSWGAARAADGSQVALAAAARVPGLGIVGEIVDVLPTPYGAAELIRGHVRRNPGRIAVARTGPSANLAADLDALTGVRLADATDSDYAVACANLMDALKDGAYHVRPNPDLDAAVGVAVKRGIGDGAFVWARRTAGVPIATLEALTLAMQEAARPRVGKPRIITADDAA